MLLFGLWSVPIIFITVADAIEWCVRPCGVSGIDHYLDNYIIISLLCMEQANGLSEPSKKNMPLLESSWQWRSKKDQQPDCDSRESTAIQPQGSFYYQLPNSRSYGKSSTKSVLEKRTQTVGRLIVPHMKGYLTGKDIPLQNDLPAPRKMKPTPSHTAQSRIQSWPDMVAVLCGEIETEWPSSHLQQPSHIWNSHRMHWETGVAGHAWWSPRNDGK